MADSNMNGSTSSSTSAKAGASGAAATQARTQKSNVNTAGAASNTSAAPSAESKGSSVGASTAGDTMSSSKLVDQALSYTGLSREDLSKGASAVMERVRGIPQMSSDIAGRVHTGVKANPWIGVGVAGVGGLLLGYFFGRRGPSGVIRSFSSRYADEAIDE